MDDETSIAMKRALARLEDDFEPNIGTQMHPASNEDRSTHALEYIAYQLGKIRKILEEKDS